MIQREIDVTLLNKRSNPILGYELSAVAVSAGGYVEGFTKPFDALIDTGARNTCISKKIMKGILEQVRDKQGNELRPVGQRRVGGVLKGTEECLEYRIPHLYLGGLHLENVIVVEINSDHLQCLIGRSILHQCKLTCDAEENSIRFEFKKDLKDKWDGFYDKEQFSSVSDLLETTVDTTPWVGTKSNQFN